ncbi:MAG: MamK family actin-like protein [Planctomycetota bacterium]
MSDSERTSDAANKDHGVLYLGMDLGTSRTSVSASNGVRETVLSVVGYPKDVVSKKLLKKDVLFGKEALERRLSLRLHRPLQKGVFKYNDLPEGADRGEVEIAARDLIREAIRLARPRKDELVYAVIGVPAQASIHNKEAILGAARASVDSVMLCSEPFAVAYGLDMLDDALIVDIGAGTTDLCRMHGTMPEDSDQITIPFAGDVVDEKLEELMRQHCVGASFSLQMVKEIKERYSHLGNAPERALVTLPVDGKPTEFDVTDLVKQACSIVVGPIIDGVRKLIGSFDPEFQHRLRNRVVLAGGGSMIRGLDSAIEDAMRKDLGGGKVVHVDEPLYGGANGALKIAHDMPADYWEQLR